MDTKDLVERYHWHAANTPMGALLARDVVGYDNPLAIKVYLTYMRWLGWFPKRLAGPTMEASRLQAHANHYFADNRGIYFELNKLSVLRFAFLFALIEHGAEFQHFVPRPISKPGAPRSLKRRRPVWKAGPPTTEASTDTTIKTNVRFCLDLTLHGRFLRPDLDAHVFIEMTDHSRRFARWIERSGFQIIEIKGLTRPLIRRLHTAPGTPLDLYAIPDEACVLAMLHGRAIPNRALID